MSRHLGIGEKLWKLYEDEQGTPGWGTLQKLTELGYNVAWLMTGEGDMRLDVAKATALPFDEKFMARVTVAVATAYREANQALGEANAGAAAHRILSAVLGDAKHPEEYEDQLAIQIKRLRRDLAEARANPGQGKVSA